MGKCLADALSPNAYGLYVQFVLGAAPFFSSEQKTGLSEVLVDLTEDYGMTYDTYRAPVEVQYQVLVLNLYATGSDVYGPINTASSCEPARNNIIYYSCPDFKFLGRES
jgi:hypothetical protein